MSREIGKETFLKAVLRRYLLRQFPDLTSQELDFMVGVALEDLLNYVAFSGNYIYEASYRERAVEQLAGLAESDPIGFDRLVTEHMEVWSIKWNQRVKLVLGKDAQDSRGSENLERKVGQLIPLLKDLYSWLQRFAVGSLISNGEVCFTNLIAETVVKEVLYKLVSSMSIQEAAKFVAENPAFLISEIVQRARGAARYRGNLVIVRVNPSFFEENRGEVIEW
ncbi:MAG: hypothetical protein QXT33_01515 [Thermofilum sp.]